MLLYDIVLRSEGELGDVLGAAVLVDHDDVVLPEHHDNMWPDSNSLAWLTCIPRPPASPRGW